MTELQSSGVQIYQFPVDDETVAETNNSMNVSYLHKSYLSALERQGWVVKTTASVNTPKLLALVDWWLTLVDWGGLKILIDYLYI